MAELVPDNYYVYKGSDKYGRKRKGGIFAQDEDEVRARLSHEGVQVRRISKDMLLPLRKAKKPKLRDILFFTQQLATSIKAGVPVDTALKLSADNSTNYQMRMALKTILADVESGDTLSEAFANQDHIFDQFYVSLIGVGEQSGNLEHVLQRLADSLDKLTAIKRKVKKAMTYPVIVFAIGLLVVIGLLVFVIPQFEDMFKSFGADLPAFTKAVLRASEIIRQYFPIIMGGLVLLVIITKQIFKRSEKLRYWRDETVLKMPLFGTMSQQGLIARFGRTLSTLYESGTPMTESLDQTALAMNNLVYEEIIGDINDAVSQGDRLGDAMRGTGGFTPLTTSMVEIGEETGQLHTMLDRVAETYEAALDDTVETLTTMIEPIMILFLGVMVAIILAAIYLPIFKLGDAL